MQMIMLNSNSRAISSHRRQSDGGFSLLEMVVAMLILTIGLLGVASAIGFALMASNSGRGLTNAKLLVVSALEQMETLRDSGQLNFAEISNTKVLTSEFEGFPAEFIPVSTEAGDDFVYGTADDPGIAIAAKRVQGVMRQILITDETPTLKKIKVTLRYSPNGGHTQDLVCVSYLNNNARGNYTP